MFYKSKILLILLLAVTVSYSAESVTIVSPQKHVPRIAFGVEKITNILQALDYEASISSMGNQAYKDKIIIIGTRNNSQLPGGNDAISQIEIGKEGFVLKSDKDRIYVIGADPSGVLYGCLELADRIKTSGALPTDLDVTDQPSMVLRGTVIGMQKPKILPGRKMYEYPYTPDNFPFFYDKSFWKEYLDLMVDNRLNTLYLWNGHPFASLVKLKAYPYAIEVSDAVFEKNVEMFEYITTEADKRGIWIIQMFYNIFVSQPFAERHNIDTQHREPSPLVSDYNRKSIAAFVEKYPNVGLLVCLGEALRGTENQVEWFTKVIIPGVQDGLKALGKSEEPPIVLRAHATDPKAIMEAALPLYKNLYTMAKYNGESLTTTEPRGPWRQVHLDMSRLGSQHVVNVHILANLEPFRYGAQRFIQKSVQAMEERLEAQGLHLYPLFYWNWPYAGDKATPQLLQYERDWMWFEAWARYAWDPWRDEAGERTYWIDRLTQQFGSEQAATYILNALNDAGECAPMLLRRFGITEGNRQTFSLGMTLDQLANPEPYSPFPDLWLSQAPPGERLQEYADKEWNKQPHVGETPPSVIHDAVDFADRAVNSIQQAEEYVTLNKAEFERYENDIICIQLLSWNYYYKVKAAMDVLRYDFSNDIHDLQSAETNLAKSLEYFKELTDRTRDTYNMAQSMLTYHRRIPFPGEVDGTPYNYHWTQVLPLYEEELAGFKKYVSDLESGKVDPNLRFADKDMEPYPNADYELLSDNGEYYTVEMGARVFTDEDFEIRDIAPEFIGLKGIRFSNKQAQHDVMTFRLKVNEPLRLLVGYFKSKDPKWLQVPNPDFEARANERGGFAPRVRNAAIISELPALDVHNFEYEPGVYDVEMIGKGSYIILGAVPMARKVLKRDAKRIVSH